MADFALKTYHLILLLFILIMACNSTQQPEKAEVSRKNKNELTKRAEVEELRWPENGETKSFKVDSSSFEVRADRARWFIYLEEKQSFKSQMVKMKKVMSMIAKEANLSELELLSIRRHNAELFADIALVPEIQTDLKRAKNGDGIVDSMSVISEYAYKSKYLDEFTSIFRKLNLEPYDYYIDKCYCIEKIRLAIQ